ncbi:MAG: alpha/beta hydrolase fold domain-containing protein [Prochloraceae cyanobacterium]
MFQDNLADSFSFLGLIPLILSLFGFLLALWIVIPAPNMFLLRLGVGAPEISPLLIIVNAIALLLGIVSIGSWYFAIIMICSSIALLLSLLPLSQFSATSDRFGAEMAKAWGENYLENIPLQVRNQMRPFPFLLKDFFRGIPKTEVRIERGIIFASPDGVDLKLNVYRPLKTGKYPTLVVIYGGAWRSGSPDGYEDFNCYLAARDYCVIAVDYRHAPKYKFPAQLEDVTAALKYIRDRSEELEVDRERMAVMGRSAGGHLALLSAYQQNAVPLRAVVKYYGPVNLTKGYYDPPVPNPINSKNVMENFLGGSPEEFFELYQKASPITYTRPNLPPTLLIYAGRDHLTQPKFGKDIEAKLKDNKNIAIRLEIPWAEHSFDAVFSGLSNQLALYYTERFLAIALKSN